MIDDAIYQHSGMEGEFEAGDEPQRCSPIVYPSPLSGGTQYGVRMHLAAQQWEIVAVEAGRPRHVAFVSSMFALTDVLGVAAEISGGPIRPAMVRPSNR